MIFESPKVRELCVKYHSNPNFNVPGIVSLARSRDLAGERAYIENLAAQFDAGTRIEWTGRFTSPNDGAHLGAWFEIMLFGWLREFDAVQAQPTISGNAPDFQLSAARQGIIIEACIATRPASQKMRDVRTSEIMSALEGIRRPYLISVSEMQIADSPLEGAKFVSDVTSWLDSSPSSRRMFDDKNGNRVLLRAEYLPNAEHVMVAFTSWSWIGGVPLKNPLKHKAGQHASLRKAGHPYVVCVLLESAEMTAEEVVEAWFGQQQTMIDPDSMQVMGQTFDRSGILFRGTEILHKTVSGTLVFRRELSSSLQRHTLKAWYIQNPVASVPVVPGTFPTVADYIVTRQSHKGFWMAWHTRSS